MVRGILLLVIPTILSLGINVEGRMDFYSSSLRTQSLLQTHNQLLSTFQEYATALEEVSSVMRRYASESETQQISEPWTSNGDPLKTYLLIRRTTKDLDSVVEALRRIRSLDPLSKIENLRREEMLPDQTDYHGAVKSLVRLQKMYLIPPEDLAQGKIADDLQSPVKLTASDCLRIGEISEGLVQKEIIPVHAKLWYSAGIGLARNNSDQSSMEQVLQDRQNELEERTKTLTLTPEEFEDVNKDILSTTLHRNSSWPYIEKTARRLCRGEYIRSPLMDAETLCYLRQGPHPYMKLRPLKVEEKNLDPYLVVLHDVIGDREIQILKDAAILKNEPSTHVLADASTGTSDIRVSVTSWLKDNHTPSLSKRIGIFLGMKTNATLWDVEEYQVLNYGAGGHYSLHRDFFDNVASDIHLNTSGNRLATLMFYLNDVEKGGSTIFPFMGQALRPQKGAAAFWWNLRSGGNGDFKTTHSACPVIYGTKWVANKWFRERGQTFLKPCGRDPNDIVSRL